MVDRSLAGRIDRDPGRPEQAVIRGTRLRVDYICGRIARGATAADILRDHPELVAEDILACLLVPLPDAWAPGELHCRGFDLGHQGDVDYPQLLQWLRLTPEQRLARHEGWRLFAKEALRHAGLRQGTDSPTGAGTG